MNEGGASADERIALGIPPGDRAPADAARNADAAARALSTSSGRLPAAIPRRRRSYLSQGESPRDEKLDASELAAYTTVASLILNLDETITKE